MNAKKVKWTISEQCVTKFISGEILCKCTLKNDSTYKSAEWTSSAQMSYGQNVHHKKNVWLMLVQPRQGKCSCYGFFPRCAFLHQRRDIRVLFIFSLHEMSIWPAQRNLIVWWSPASNGGARSLGCDSWLGSWAPLSECAWHECKTVKWSFPTTKPLSTRKIGPWASRWFERSGHWFGLLIRLACAQNCVPQHQKKWQFSIPSPPTTLSHLHREKLNYCSEWPEQNKCWSLSAERYCTGLWCFTNSFQRYQILSFC